jgi:hypothetical protein
MLNAGASTQSVVLAVLRSAEAATLNAQDLFAAFLGRQPDTNGLAGFVNATMSGISNEFLVLFVVASPEFYNDAQAI